jgi:hypothetical protein
MYRNIPESKHDSFCKRVINVQSAFKSYQCPTTKEEYWQVVDDYWSNLLDIILINVFTEAKRLKLPHDAVVDPDYGVKTTWELFKLLDTNKYTRYFSADTSNESAVMFFRSEITCAYIFGVKKELNSILGHLKLYN